MAQTPKLLQGPEPVETTDLHFKLICKLKLFESSTKYDEKNCNLLAVSQHFGLVFAGNLNGFTILDTKTINSSLNFNEFPNKYVELNSKPSHLSVDFTQKYLAIVCNSKTGPVLLLYNIATFSTKGVHATNTLYLSKFVQNPDSEVVELSWQPNTDSTIMLCMSDGSVYALNEINKNSVHSLPSTTLATCLCWSPKGKQIVIGSATGTLSQYKPDLKFVKDIPPPPLFKEAVSVVSILWISSYQFVVAYNDRNNPDYFPVITIVNAAKNEPINVINYDDITYSSTLFRFHQFYLHHQSAWNLIFVSSANSIEVAVLHSKDNLAWEQWLLGDSSRAELPLNADRQETFPLGVAFDFTNQESLPWGEETLPPMPRLLLLSDEGVLCIFHIVNAASNAPQLCNPPAETINNLVSTVKLAESEATPQIKTSKPFSSQPSVSIGNSKPIYSFGSTTSFGGFTTQSPSTIPQVTMSIQGGTALGGVKDASLTLPQLQKTSQLQTQQQQTIPQMQPQQLQGFQKQQPIQQESISILTQSPSTTTALKFSSLPQAQVETSTPFFSFDPSKTTFSFSKTVTTASTFSLSTLASATSAATSTHQSESQFLQLKLTTTQTDLFAKNDLIQSTSVKQSEPEMIPATTKKSEEIDVVEKPEEVVPSKESSPGNSPGPATPDLPVVGDNVYWNALQEEISHFNSDLEQLSAKFGSLDFQVGTDNDKLEMKKRIDGLYDFWKELKDTTVSQSSEIHSVVMDLMESFAWLENAKSRNLQRKNPSFVELKKSEELDPLSVRHMSEISHLKYYIENQLKQLNTYLEKEWMEHQESYRLEVKNQMTVPPLEEVYKTMHFHLKILSKQRNLVEDLKEKMAFKKRKNKSQSTFLNHSAPVVTNQSSNRFSELSKLAENFLQLKIDKEDQGPNLENWEIMRSQIKAISDRWKKLTSDKQAALRDALSERDMITIRPVKTNIESSSFLRTLPSEKSMAKFLPKLKEEEVKRKEEKPKSPVKTNSSVSLKPQQTKPEPEVKEVKQISEAKVEDKQEETPKIVFVFGANPPANNSSSPLVSQPPPNKFLDKSPLTSLSAIVSNIGTDNEPKPKPPTPFVFGSESSSFQNSNDPSPLLSDSNQEKKPEEQKTGQSFTFRMSAPTKPIFDKLEPPKFGTKPTFDFPVLTSATPNPTITPSSAAPITSSTFSFSFGKTTTTTTNSSSLPKVSFMFGKDQPTTLGSKEPSGNFISAPLTSSSTVATTVTGTVTGTATGTATTVTTTSATSPPLPTSTLSTPIFGLPPPVFGGTKLSETSSTSSPAETSTVSVASTTQPATTTSSVFSFSTSSISFGQTTTTTAITTSASIFGQTPATTTNIFGQVSTTSTTSIFGGGSSAVSGTTSTNIFGGFTSSKPIFGQASTPSTSAGSIFGGSTPTTNIFGQPSTPTTSPTAFGQKPDSNAQISNLFGQLLSDSNQSGGFGTPATTPTKTTNIFSKNIFLGANATPQATTASLFGKSSTPIFPQANSVFGQPTTTSSVFEPTSTSTPSSFFGQNICSSFGGKTSTTFTFQTSGFQSKVFFGQSLFGQSTNNTSIFGRSPNTSIFGGSSTSPTSGGNVFQTPTTSSTFGSNSPGSFGRGGGSVAESGFGAPNTFQTPVAAGGFGSPPVFGRTPTSTPAFGASPTFRGSSSFGSLITFGSRPGGFDASQGSFSQAAGHSTTFENLAKQNTVGFGNLAQQSQNQGFGNVGGFGSSSFENKPAFGGNSFSSWRSK